jgi:DNA-binding MarR family transcriptional regulator
MKIQKEESIGKLISILYRQAQVYLNKELKEIELTYSEYITLVNIEINQSFNQKHLAGLLVIDAALVTRSLKTLEKKGYIIKEKSLKDKRSYDIKLTQKGIRTQPIILKALESLTAIISEGMDENEKFFLIQKLKMMSSHLLKVTKKNK